MYVLRQPHLFRIMPTLLLAALASCDFDEPPAKDASAIYGCYTAPDAPRFSLGAAGMRVEGSQAAVPFRYELRKVGYAVNVPLLANVTERRFALSAGENHFYRMVPSDAGPTIVVAFGPTETTKIYTRKQSSNCVF